MNSLKRALAVILCLCLIPVCSLAEEPTTHTASDSPVYRSDFTLRLGLNADGFPKGTATDYKAWEEYLSKLSLRGVIDTQDMLEEFSRVYFDGGLYLNEKKALPFTYDGYYSFRYIRSPALAGASVHFQMWNFLEFMMKPYYFMELPTQYLALLMYPEASQALGKDYYEPILNSLGGEGTRAIPYETLESLALELDEIYVNDEFDCYRLYYYITCLLIDLGASEVTYEKLGCLESWLEWLDPDREGLQITADGRGGESWVIGGREVFTRSDENGGTHWTLSLPDEEDYTLVFDWSRAPKEVGADIGASLKILSGDEARVDLSLRLNGLPKDDELEAFGDASYTVGGSALEGGEQRFEFRYSRDAQSLPYNMTLGIDWLHPDTGEAALTLVYNAAMEEHDNTILVDRAIDNQDDFFELNESVIEEYKEAFLPTLALGFAPFVVEMPTPVFNDIFNYLNDTGALGIIGLE